MRKENYDSIALVCNALMYLWLLAMIVAWGAGASWFRPWLCLFATVYAIGNIIGRGQGRDV